MYKYILIILLSIVVGINESYAVGVSSIGGMSVDATAPPPPSGLCSGGRTLTLTDGGTVTTTAIATAAGVFKAAPSENTYEGVGYGLAAHSGTNDTRLLSFDLGVTPITVTGNVLVNTASVPDTGTQIRANIYDSSRAGSGGFLVFGSRTDASCTSGVFCLHIRGYTNTTTLIDLTYTAVRAASSFYIAYMIPDSSSYWVAYQIPAAGHTIRKFDSGLNSIGAITDTPNTFNDITSDGTAFVYATVNIGGTESVRRIRISDLAITDFAVVGGVNGAILYVNGFLYVGQPAAIKKVRVSDMTVVDTLLVTETPIVGGFSYDAVNDRMYSIGTIAGTTQYRRINLNTFTSEQNLGIASVLSTEAFGTGIDFIHQRIWQALAQAGNNLVIQKINLCS